MSKERLTEKTKDCFGYRLKDGSDAEVGFFKDYDAFYSRMMVVKALGEYEELEEQGLLLRLPCHCKDCKHVDYAGCAGMGWWSEMALDDLSKMACADCKYKGKRHQKCSCCIRNRNMKDCYESEE